MNDNQPAEQMRRFALKEAVFGPRGAVILDLAEERLNLRAALAAYDAQYEGRPIGQQHQIPEGAAQRVEDVVEAARSLLSSLQADPNG